MHITHHLINQRALGGRAAIGFLGKEIAVEAIVVHDLNQLVRHRERAIGSLLNKLPNLLHIGGTVAPGEAQGCHHRDAVGVGRIGKFPGGAADQTLFRARPIHKGIGILPIVEGVGEKAFASLRVGIVMIGIGHRAKHQLCLRIGQGVDHKAAYPISQRNAGPAVGCIGVRLRGPLQQSVHIKRWTDGHQRLMGRIGLIHLHRSIVAGGSGRCGHRQSAKDHYNRQKHGKHTVGFLGFHGLVSLLVKIRMSADHAAF